MPPFDLLQLGALATIFLFAIREFFGYLREKSHKQCNGGELNGQILTELRLMNQNHLNSIKEAIQEGNSRIVQAIHSDNKQMIEVLGRIEGALQNRQ